MCIHTWRISPSLKKKIYSITRFVYFNKIHKVTMLEVYILSQLMALCYHLHTQAMAPSAQ